MSAVAAYIIAEQIKRKPESVVGFATGSTPLGAYKRLAELYSCGYVDFSGVISFNLDEYYPIKRDNSRSYFSFMRENLFKYVNIRPENVNIPNGECADPEKECADYDGRLKRLGGTDLQILGVGNNGHIGFNEPREELPLAAGLVDLAEDTVKANSRFFEKPEDVPRRAITLGLGGIFSSKRVLVLVSGAGKAEIVKKMFSGSVSALVPASLLNLRGGVTVIADKAADGRL
jgi:glucosamine-6-phosphate deaminase